MAGMMAKKKEGRAFRLFTQPYANQYGTIVIPNELETEEEIKKYVSEHWGDVEFAPPELDYCGTDFEVWEDGE